MPRMVRKICKTHNICDISEICVREKPNAHADYATWNRRTVAGTRPATTLYREVNEAQYIEKDKARQRRMKRK